MPKPNITSLTPNVGPMQGGLTITIQGNHLGNVMSVMFGDVPAYVFDEISATELTAVVPPQAAGEVDVTVTNMAGETSSTGPKTKFTYEANVPEVTAVTPDQGVTAGGEQVRITGSGFSGAIMVSFGGVPAWGFTVLSDTEIDAWTPTQAAGDVTVSVTNADGTSTSSVTFEYVANKPQVTGCTPDSGPSTGGPSVVITGSHFTDVTDVSFGGLPATDWLVESDTKLHATPPPQPAGEVEIMVTNADGTSDPSAGSKYTYEAVKPKVTGLLPANGTDGDTITIVGENFNNVTSVAFGGLPAAYHIPLTNTIQATVPAQTSGSVVYVRVSNMEGTSDTTAESEFTYD